MPLDFSRYRVLTFDCYGTLIDWESGILGFFRPLLGRHGKALSDDEILFAYAELESEAESGEYMTYRNVLRSVVHAFGLRLDSPASPVEADALPASLPEWPPFSDTVEALKRLKTRFQLAIISNTDDDLFAETAKRLEVPFDFVITAQQVGSYKPSLNNFQRAIERIGLPATQVLHCAQSRFHDIAPARSLGLATVWVNRRAGKATPWGASVPSEARPDLEVPDLKTLAALAVP
ncbi:MAG TPA: haloacid dehalogenase type II [Terriglobales bacterium]|nr:haloacid dehalogenase type II [Terriglobales bacterium]